MLGASDLTRLYRALYRVRRVEEEIARIYPSDQIKSPVHLSIGQEAVAVGVCDVLRPDDTVFGTYRGHASYLAKGGDLGAMLAELYGKDTGCARGKGGSMHLIDPDHGVMGTSAVVATTIPHAVGYAYAQRYLRTDRVTVSFFGDGATEEGAYHESLNFAALKKLPVLFICENNHFAIHSRLLDRRSLPNIAEQAAAHGMAAERIEDNDVVRIRERAAEAVAALRAGGGPRLLECMTYRWKEHVGPNDDWALGYRTAHDARAWIEGDQVAKLGAMIDATVRREIDAGVEAEIRQAIEFAERSPFPAADELLTDVFTE
jgi:TPP-dependent pyruvate/acetoin dehydrogenase alpha subunit